MAKFRLSVCPAYSTRDGLGITMLLSMLLSKNDGILPQREVEASNTRDAMNAFADYTKEAEATGKSLAVTISLGRRDRAPRGFNQQKHTQYVNLRTEAEEMAREDKRQIADQFGAA